MALLFAGTARAGGGCQITIEPSTITMASDTQGTWTVWGFIPATECGDSAILTVTGTVPDTALAGDASRPWSALGILLMALALLGLPPLVRR